MNNNNLLQSLENFLDRFQLPRYLAVAFFSSIQLNKNKMFFFIKAEIELK